MIQLSVVVITKNEEKNIGRCLASVKGIADEVVVVDSGSTDQTQAICEQTGARFISQTWLGYAEQKNFGNSQASHDWILSLDADESLSEELQKNLLSWKKNTSKTDFVYLFNRLTNYCGHWVKHCGWYPDRKVRLINRQNAKWIGEIHETIQSSLPVLHIKGDILHHSYYTVREHIAQLNLFTDMMAQDAIRKGKKGGLFKIIGSPLFQFVKSYIFQLGFLDGYYGWVICTISAHATFIKYVKIKELESKN